MENDQSVCIDSVILFAILSARARARCRCLARARLMEVIITEKGVRIGRSCCQRLVQLWEQLEGAERRRKKGGRGRGGKGRRGGGGRGGRRERGGGMGEEEEGEEEGEGEERWRKKEKRRRSKERRGGSGRERALLMDDWEEGEGGKSGRRERVRTLFAEEKE